MGNPLHMYSTICPLFLPSLTILTFCSIGHGNHVEMLKTKAQKLWIEEGGNSDNHLTIYSFKFCKNAKHRVMSTGHWAATVGWGEDRLHIGQLCPGPERGGTHQQEVLGHARAHPQEVHRLRYRWGSFCAISWLNLSRDIYAINQFWFVKIYKLKGCGLNANIFKRFDAIQLYFCYILSC